MHFFITIDHGESTISRPWAHRCGTLTFTLMIKISANAVATLFRLILNVLRVASRCFSSAALAFYEQQSNNNCKKKEASRVRLGLPQHNENTNQVFPSQI